MKNFNLKTLFPLFVLILFIITACDEGSDQDFDNSPLPPDPMDWICEETNSKTQEVMQFCDSVTDFGTPAPENLRMPPSIFTLEEKNSFDLEFRDFLRNREYLNELNWIRDMNWRLTGPYVGAIGSGESFGAHPAVKIYYSPEVVEWLCNNREGELPDGSIIIKEMHSINQELDITLDNQGCMKIQADVQPESWTIMIRDSTMAHDGWYWGGYSVEDTDPASWQIGNPPVFDASAATNNQFPASDVTPSVPEPLWYPTGYVFESNNKIPDIVYPFSIYGNACINCHSSAAKEMTFSSLDNVVSEGLRFKQFASLLDLTDLPEELEDVAPHAPGQIPLTTIMMLEGFTNPFTIPMAQPTQSFLDFYSQLSEVTLSDTWPNRFPAETYDHVVSKGVIPPEFVTSDQCQECHDSTYSNASLPNMIFEEEKDGKTELINLSPYGEWKASPMGMAGRDPIFFSQLQSETNNLPDLADCIENTCLHCHGVMGQRQFGLDNQKGGNDVCKELFAIQPPDEVPFGDTPYTRDKVAQWPGSENNEDSLYGALSRDGISCLVCHRMSETKLGDADAYTGNFVTGPSDEIYGPYENITIVPKPMENSLGMIPEFRDYFVSDEASSSDLCGTCHNILLPKVTNESVIVGASYEQTTHLEWANSDFAPGRSDFLSCANCHMPTHYKGEDLSFEIANIESNDFAPTTNRLPDEDITLTERDDFARHSLHGLNIFINEMFQQFPVLLGFRQIDYMTGTATVPSLITGRNSMIEMANNETASIEIESLEINDEGILEANIKVINKVGHYLPSGVGFRRVFIEFVVRDSDNNILWASGMTNSIGAILNGITDEVLESEQPVVFPDTPFQPHYQVIDSEDQVQIYQELIKDSDGILTTSFLRRIEDVKDNRLRPKGYDPEFFNTFDSPFIQALSELHGEAANDAYYSDPLLTGADLITYIADLGDQIENADNIRVTLYNQSIPPFYLQQRFRDASRGPAKKDDIERLFYMTSHLNVDAVTDEDGNQVITDWKFFISSTTQKLN